MFALQHSAIGADLASQQKKKKPAACADGGRWADSLAVNAVLWLQWAGREFFFSFVFFHHHQLAYWFLSYLHFRISGQWKMYSLDFLVSVFLLLDERIMKSQFSLLNWKKAGFPLCFWLWPILWTLRSDRKTSRSLFGWRPAEVFLCGLALFSSKIPPFPCVLIQASCCW